MVNPKKLHFQAKRGKERAPLTPPLDPRMDHMSTNTNLSSIWRRHWSSQMSGHEVGARCRNQATIGAATQPDGWLPLCRQTCLFKPLQRDVRVTAANKTISQLIARQSPGVNWCFHHSSDGADGGQRSERIAIKHRRLRRLFKRTISGNFVSIDSPMTTRLAGDNLA